MAQIDEDRTIALTFTRTLEGTLELDFPEMAKTLGISKTKLAQIVNDGADYEPSDAAKARILRQANEDSDEFEIDDIS